MANLFTSASLKLTGWYLLILMVVSVLFSGLLFGVATGELRHGLRAPARPQDGGVGLFMDSYDARQLRESRFQEARGNLAGNLILFNLGTLILGGGASYLLARRTLRPIREAMDAQARFVSDASHELRTPLAVMQSEIEVSLRAQASKKEYHEILESNLEEVNRLRQLTDRLLLLSGDSALELQALPLDEVVADALAHVVTIAQSKSIAIDNKVAPINARVNRESLADAITILLENAIKYSPKETTVVVTSEAQGRYVLLHITDHGQGIAREDINKIFDRFYRADQSRSKLVVEGHGLGLSIARRIVELHDGVITAESELGKGTTFTLKLNAE